MKRVLFLVTLCLIGLSPFVTAGVWLEVAPIEEWDLTSSSATFTIDFLGDPSESGEFHLQIREGDPGLFTDTFTMGPAAGDLGYGLIMTIIGPMPPNHPTASAASPSTVYYTNYEVTVDDSQGNLPGGLLAQLTFYQEGYGNTLIEVFKDPDYTTSLASVLIAIVDFPCNDDIPVPDNDDDIPVPGDDIGDGDVPEPATVVLLALGGVALRRRK